MTGRRTLAIAAAAVTAVLWAYACGDGGTEPITPPPDPPRPATVTVTPATATLGAPDETVQLRAEVRDQNGKVMAVAGTAWSSSDASVATVDGAGLVTAAGNGTTTITATVGGASGSAAVKVMQSARSVTVSPAADTTAPADSLRLTATARDGNGHLVNDAEFTWSSSDMAVAAVDGSGLVTGMAEGVATITASSGGAEGAAEITVENPDRAALVALYNVTDGPNWINSDNWLTDAPLGEWYGVRTDAGGRVVGLDLKGSWDDWPEVIPHGLKGPLPTELGNLSNLRHLDLATNELTGPIPQELGALANMTRLDLGDNALTGEIPSELGTLANLVTLRLSYNDLAREIPPQLGGLANLLELDLRQATLANQVTVPSPNNAPHPALSTRLGHRVRNAG